MLQHSAQMAEALQSVRESLQADGADLEVLGLDGTVGRVKLVVGPETCQECIMPRDFLEQMMLMNVQEVLPQVTRVEVEDPRDD
jgi:Fe-S cluster biogenesis protein NfuA